MSLAKEHTKARWSLQLLHGAAIFTMAYSMGVTFGSATIWAVGFFSVALVLGTERAIRTGIEASDEESDLQIEDIEALHVQVEALEIEKMALLRALSAPPPSAPEGARIPVVGEAWRHQGNEHLYIVVAREMAEDPRTPHSWVDSVRYRDVAAGVEYTRSVARFVDRFTFVTRETE